MESRGRSSVGRYRSNLRGVVSSSATAYGYTLTVWSTGAVLMHAYGPPSPPLVFAFFGGAVLAFALVGVVSFGSVTAELGGGPDRVGLHSTFHFLSVGSAVAAAWLVSGVVPSFPGWMLGTFAATAAYLIVAGAENTLAHRPEGGNG